MRSTQRTIKRVRQARDMLIHKIEFIGQITEHYPVICVVDNIEFIFNNVDDVTYTIKIMEGFLGE